MHGVGFLLIYKLKKANIIWRMNQYTQQEQISANYIYFEANQQVAEYANAQDHEAATIALLIEALILAGGQSLLKPTEENE